jgi:MFS family permease
MTEPEGEAIDGGTTPLRQAAPPEEPHAETPVDGPLEGPRLLRWAAASAYLMVGLVFSSYLVRVPTFKLALGLSDGQLGLLMVVPTVSALVVMQVSGSLVARFGSSVIVRVSSVVLPLALVGIGLAGDVLWFVVALLVFGAVDGLIDVSMNAHAVAVERRLGRSVMNGCHAGWSIGAMVGSGLGGLAIKVGLSPTWHFVALGAAVVILALVAGRHLLPAAADRAAAPDTPGMPDAADEGTAGDGTPPRRTRAAWRAGWSRRVLIFGAMGAVAMLTEGAVGSWSGVFLHDELNATLATASLGYIGFAVCQTGVRLIGDRLHDRYGAPVLFRWSGALGVAGLALAVLGPGPVLAIAGFTLMGAGLAVLLPIIFSAVGHGGTDEGAAGAAAALSRFSTLTYAGLLLGPVLIGWCAEAFGLTATLAGLLVLMLAVTLNAKATATADRHAT